VRGDRDGLLKASGRDTEGRFDLSSWTWAISQAHRCNFRRVLGYRCRSFASPFDVERGPNGGLD
jgi:hypothetical protein